MKSARCQTGVQNQINIGQPIFEFQTVTIPATAGVIGVDIPVKFNAPHKFFMVCSILNTVNTSMVCFHFKPLGFNSGGTSSITPTGAEQWIPLSNPNSSAGKVEGRWIKFRTPVQSFFITADHPAANPGTYQITILGTDDIEAVISERT